MGVLRSTFHGHMDIPHSTNLGYGICRRVRCCFCLVCCINGGGTFSHSPPHSLCAILGAPTGFWPMLSYNLSAVFHYLLFCHRFTVSCCCVCCRLQTWFSRKRWRWVGMRWIICFVRCLGTLLWNRGAWAQTVAVVWTWKRSGLLDPWCTEILLRRGCLVGWDLCRCLDSFGCGLGTGLVVWSGNSDHQKQWIECESRDSRDGPAHWYRSGYRFSAWKGNVCCCCLSRLVRQIIWVIERWCLLYQTPCWLIGRGPRKRQSWMDCLTCSRILHRTRLRLQGLLVCRWGDSFLQLVCAVEKNLLLSFSVRRFFWFWGELRWDKAAVKCRSC